MSTYRLDRLFAKSDLRSTNISTKSTPCMVTGESRRWVPLWIVGSDPRHSCRENA